MVDIPLGVPVEIGGKDVIIFRDVIGTDSLRNTRDNEVLTIVEQETADGRPPIFIDEGELLRLRDSYPGIQVYGLWQLLFANNKVPLGNEVIVYPLGPDSGLYIRLNPEADLNNPRAIITSSEYSDNFVPELMEFNLDNATKISVEMSELRLPGAPAYTRAEIYDRNRQVLQRRWIVVGALCFAVIVATGIFNYGLYTVYTMDMTAYANKKNELQVLNDRLLELQSRRLNALPKDEETLNRIVDLQQIEPGLATPEPGDYGVSPEARFSFANTEQLLVTTPGYELDLKTTYDWLVSEKTPTDQYVIRFSASLSGGGQN